MTPRTSRKPLLLGIGALVLVSGGLVTYTFLDDDARTGGSTSNVDLACGIAEIRPEIPSDDLTDDPDGYHEIGLELTLLQAAALEDETLDGGPGRLQDLHERLVRHLDFEGAEADLAAFEEEMCVRGAGLPVEYPDRLATYTDHACGLLPSVTVPPWAEEREDGLDAALASANLVTIRQVGMMTRLAGVEQEFTLAVAPLEEAAQDFDDEGYAREVAALAEVCAAR